MISLGASQAPVDAKLVVRYSHLNQYLSGQTDLALRGIYEGFKNPGNRAMRTGRRYHREWKLAVDLNGRLPLVFGAQRITNAVTEQAMRVQLNPWLIVESEPDVYGMMRFAGKNWRTIVEYKSGSTPIGNYLLGDQIPLYQIFYPNAEMARFYHYNQYQDVARMGLMYLDKRTLEQGINYAVGNADNIRAERFSQGKPWWNHVGA